MRKIGFLLPFVGLALATTVYAYSGSHDFLEMVTTTSDSHLYQSEYRASGSFPFDGTGAYDTARVNLKGILTVSAIDGEPVSESYCAKLRGTLSGSGGELLAIRYADLKCQEEVARETYTVLSYSEIDFGSFTVVAVDKSGREWTTSGLHQFVAREGKGGGKK